ncbi:TlpA family protein disulfide reductase [Actinophytocola sediminis]
MTSAARWSLAGLVLVIAAVVAIWPRGEDPPAEPAGPDLGQVRAAAALQPCPAGDSPPARGPLNGIEVECLADGSAVDLAATLATSPVLVNVWATWCPPCREELPLLASYAAQPGAVPVVGLAVQSSQADALALLDSLDVQLPTVLDRDGTASTALKLPAGLPASYLVDADGTVRLIDNPRLFRSVAEIQRAVELA